METYQRLVFSSVQKELESPKVSLIIGARQVGKTTLIGQIISQLPEEQWVSYNADDSLFRAALERDPKWLQRDLEARWGMPFKSLIERKIVVIDEIQKCPLLFEVVKIWYDNKYPVKVLASGSSSLEIQKKNAESLAGRSFVTRLFPFCLTELVKNEQQIFASPCAEMLRGKLSEEKLRECQQQLYPHREAILRSLENLLILGGLPEVVSTQNIDAKHKLIKNMITTYLEKDIRTLSTIASESDFVRSFELISTAHGQLVTLSEMASEVGINRATLKKYLAIMEATFVVTALPSLQKKARKSQVKSEKIFVYDNGIVNFFGHVDRLEHLIQSNAIGSCLEQIFLMNVLAQRELSSFPPQLRYFRDYERHEIDFILEQKGRFLPIEITYQTKVAPEKWRNLKHFLGSFGKTTSQAVFFARVEHMEVKRFEGKEVFILPLWMMV